MRSPFPGIDPYLEAQGGWPDFHAAYLAYCREILNGSLPDSYAARIEESVYLMRTPAESVAVFRPDVAIVRESRVTSHTQSATAGIATLEPITIPVEMDRIEEVRETWIEIRKLPEMSLVTVIELLSPAIKIGAGRQEYLNKRVELFSRPVHLVELDFLLRGHRLPMRKPLPKGDAYAIVSRMERRPNAEVYAWTLRDGLPTIPIPLAAPDPDVPLDLAPAFSMAYERGRYARIIRYAEPLTLPLDPEERTWIEKVSGTVSRENGS